MVGAVEQTEGSSQHMPEGRSALPELVRGSDRPHDDGGPHALHLLQAPRHVRLLQEGVHRISD